MNEMAYVLQAWLPLLVWQQVEAPKYRKGFITVTFLSAALIVTALVIRVLHARELAERRKSQEVGEFNGSRSSEEDVGVSTEAHLDNKKLSD
jgi:ACS family pantothenate transporter-like MFS transporter